MRDNCWLRESIVVCGWTDAVPASISFLLGSGVFHKIGSLSGDAGMAMKFHDGLAFSGTGRQNTSAGVNVSGRLAPSASRCQHVPISLHGSPNSISPPLLTARIPPDFGDTVEYSSHSNFIFLRCGIWNPTSGMATAAAALGSSQEPCDRFAC